MRHLNPLKTHPERLTKADRRIISSLDYGDIKFHVSKKDYGRIEEKNSIYITVFYHEDGLVYQVSVAHQRFEKCMDLLLIAGENRFNRFMCHKTIDR